MCDFLRITLPVFGFGALAFWWAGRRVSPGVRRARWIKFAIYVVIVHAFLAAALAGRSAITMLIALIAAAGVFEIASAGRRIRRQVAFAVFSVFAAIAACALAFAASAPPKRVAFLYLVVAAFDGFSQAGGQIAGRRRLAPAISPGKTVEGFLIGVAGAIVCALLLRGAVSLSQTSATLVALFASVAGVGGDLAASWVKRRAGLKDYGTFVPGHGGVLDRFDSFMAVAAAAFVTNLFR